MAVIGFLPECYVSVTCGCGAACRLVGMQESSNNNGEVFEGGRYARTEEELFEKAIALLDKCRMIPRPFGREKAESTVRSS